MFRKWKRSQYVPDDVDCAEASAIIMYSEAGAPVEVKAEFNPLSFETTNKENDDFIADVVQNWHCCIIKTIECFTHLYVRNEEGVFKSREIVLSNEELLKINGYSTVEEEQFRMVIEASQATEGVREVRKRIERIRTHKLLQNDINRVLEDHIAALSFLKEDDDGNYGV